MSFPKALWLIFLFLTLSNAEKITKKPLHKACNPDALIPECGDNAICARVPRCQLGVCVCRLDDNYLPSLRNNVDCEDPFLPMPRPTSPSICGLLKGTRFGAFSKVKRSLCGGDNYQTVTAKATRPPSLPAQRPQHQHQHQHKPYPPTSSGKLLDRGEDCNQLTNWASKCNAQKGLTCDGSERRCTPNCQQWPNLGRHDGTCYTAGYDEPCEHNHECNWMYQGTAAGNSDASGNAVCDEKTLRCRCNEGYVAVPRVAVNYYLAVQKQLNQIDVGVYNISVLLSTSSNEARSNEPLSVSYVCLKENWRSRVSAGGTCSYQLTSVSEPKVCEPGLVCQYCPQEREDNQREVFGSCVSIEFNEKELPIGSKLGTAGSAESLDGIARIIIAVGVVVATILIAVAAFLIWRRHHSRMQSISGSVKMLSHKRLGSPTEHLNHHQQLQQQEQLHQPLMVQVPPLDNHQQQPQQQEHNQQQQQIGEDAATGLIFTEQAPLASPDRSEVSRV